MEQSFKENKRRVLILAISTFMFATLLLLIGVLAQIKPLLLVSIIFDTLAVSYVVKAFKGKPEQLEKIVSTFKFINWK